jgi:gluconate 2-dehydrogenase alpha chain
MSTIMHPATDVVIAGLGQMGGPVAAELTRAGYNVVGIDKGRYWQYATDWTPYEVHDEWQLMIERKFDHPLYLSTFTMRNNSTQFALPKRRYSKGGDGVLGHAIGGAATHYGMNMSRFGPWTYGIISNLTSRYGAAALETMLPANHDVEDWPNTYTQMTPYYQAWEQAMGISGLNQDPFSPNSTYPTPPHPPTPLGTLFSNTTEGMGYHPIPYVSAAVSEPYVNQYGVSRNACVYCGYCTGTACNNQCEVGAKSSSHVTTIPAAIATGKFTMVTQSYVFRINMNAAGTQATGVSYYDQNGNVNIQPATVVYGAIWGANITRLQQLSGVGVPYNPVNSTGSVGRAGAMGNTGSTTTSCAGTVPIGGNAYSAGNGKGGGFQIEDYKNDNFDHTGLDFISGGVFGPGQYLGAGTSLINMTNAQKQTLTPAFHASVKNVKLPTSQSVSGTAGGMTPPTKDSTWDLDPHYADIFGDPCARITATFPAQSWLVPTYLATIGANILAKMGATNITTTKQAVGTGSGPQEWGHHWRRGNPMGKSPTTSTFNNWQQCWTVPNYFATGEATETVGDETGSGTHIAGSGAYLAADGIKQYLANPGLLTGSPA